MKSSLLLTSLLFIGSYGYAVSVPAIDASYGDASHNTTKWQELATYGASNNETDSFGIFWSVDGGTTWGREDLTVGQTVQFQFNMHKDYVGTHYADHLKAWIDWDQNGSFAEANNVLTYEEVLLPEGDRSEAGDGVTRGANVVSNANYTFTSGSFLIDASYVGSLSLRGRVTCSESLTLDRNVWEDQWTAGYDYESRFAPTGKLNQGETEDWTITVNPVSDSGSTLALFGAALLGLGFLKRRKTA